MDTQIKNKLFVTNTSTIIHLERKPKKGGIPLKENIRTKNIVKIPVLLIKILSDKI